MDEVSPEEVLRFWFGDDPDRPLQHQRRWWTRDDALDAEIARRFGEAMERAASGELDAWGDTARGRLALVILLDQFPRNVHRGTSRAFAHDDRAVQLVEAALETGQDGELSPVERWFLYMPLMHAESLPIQERAVALFDELRRSVPEDTEVRQALDGALDFAVQHRDIIARFGRFPGRNDALGRQTTAAERALLENPKNRFGQ